MFKSSENLRLAAEMRALERVARPWREARRSWFDGTPESIEGRLAATERVLTYARGGITPAHMALEREASTARTELREAAHRLMVDFLDDSARAFRGSKRVAKGRGLRECINCGGALSGEEDDDKDSECGTCGKSAHEKGVDWRKKSYRTAGDMLDLSSNGGDSGSSATLRHRDDKKNNRYTIQRIPDPAHDAPHRAIVNHDDTELMSADGQHHWAGLYTAGTEEACDGCNAEPGEDCRPWCTGEQAKKNEKADKKHSSRTAGTLDDFDDSLLFGN